MNSATWRSLGILIKAISVEGWGQNPSRVGSEEIDEQGKISLRPFGVKQRRTMEKQPEGKGEWYDRFFSWGR